MSATVTADKRKTITQGLKKDVLEYSPTWNEWKPYINPRNTAHHELKDKAGAIVGACQFEWCTACKNKEAAPKARPTADIETTPQVEPKPATAAPMNAVAGEALAATDADGNPLEAKFAGASKQFTYRDQDTNTIKKARQEKRTTAVIKSTADFIDAELIPETTPGPEAQAMPRPMTEDEKQTEALSGPEDFVNAPRIAEHEELEAPPMNAEPTPPETPHAAPETLGNEEAAPVPLQGLNALRYYTGKGIKLIPCNTYRRNAQSL